MEFCLHYIPLKTLLNHLLMPSCSIQALNFQSPVCANVCLSSDLILLVLHVPDLQLSQVQPRKLVKPLHHLSLLIQPPCFQQAMRRAQAQSSAPLPGQARRKQLRLSEVSSREAPLPGWIAVQRQYASLSRRMTL